MRRDLAVARERAGILKPVPTTEFPHEEKTTIETDAPAEDQDEPAAKRVKLSPPEDEKPSPDSPPPAPVKDKVSDLGQMTDGSADDTDVWKEDAAEVSSEPDAKPVPTTPAKPSPDPKPSAPADEEPAPVPEAAQDAKPSDQALQIGTKNQPKPTNMKADPRPDSAKPPDTAVTNNDLDSLFGGPTTSIPAGDAADTVNEDPGTGDFAPNDNDDFDDIFGAPSAAPSDGLGNDNISSLLPGIEGYANDEQTGGTTGEVDFDFFNPDLMSAQPQQDAGPEGGDGLEFMDFDFGVDFSAGGNADDGDDFKFDLS